METLLKFAPAISTIIAVILAIISAATLAKAVFEYIGQNKLKRFEKFQEMSRRFDENVEISKICKLLMSNSPKLATVGKYQKEVIICFFEEIAVLNNSRILPKNLILNSFGYYAIKCYESHHFWANLDRNEPFYTLFIGFCREMVAARDNMNLGEIRRTSI